MNSPYSSYSYHTTSAPTPRYGVNAPRRGLTTKRTVAPIGTIVSFRVWKISFPLGRTKSTVDGVQLAAVPVDVEPELDVVGQAEAVLDAAREPDPVVLLDRVQLLVVVEQVAVGAGEEGAGAQVQPSRHGALGRHCHPQEPRAATAISRRIIFALLRGLLARPLRPLQSTKDAMRGAMFSPVKTVFREGAPARSVLARGRPVGCGLFLWMGRRGSGGGVRIRTGDRGFADLRLNHLATPPRAGDYKR